MRNVMTIFILLLTITGVNAFDNGNELSPPCITGPTIITVGEQYIFTSHGLSQCENCFDWDIIGSAASIVNDMDQNMTVLINADNVGQFTLFVRYLNEKECGTCSYEVTVVQDKIACENCVVSMEVIMNAAGTMCRYATAELTGCDNPSNNPIVNVEWSYGLQGHVGCETPPNSCPLDPLPNMFQTELDPIGDIVGCPLPYHYLQFYAEVTYADGTVCDPWIEELLTCDENYTCNNGLNNINIYPNPSKKGVNVNFDGINFKKIASIKIFDLSGNLRKEEKPTKQGFNIDDLRRGIYIVQFTASSGEIVQKKLLIE